MQNGDCKEFHTFPTGFSCVADLTRSRYIVKEALEDASRADRLSDALRPLQMARKPEIEEPGSEIPVQGCLRPEGHK